MVDQVEDRTGSARELAQPTGVKVDTSGAVWVDPVECPGVGWLWSDLTPFQQGYVRAAFASFRMGDIGHWPDAEARKIGFRHLHPSTLAAMLKDCEEWVARCGPEMGAGHGRDFWEDRNVARSIRFPPVTLYLGDDGRVIQREAK